MSVVQPDEDVDVRRMKMMEQGLENRNNDGPAPRELDGDIRSDGESRRTTRKLFTARPF